MLSTENEQATSKPPLSHFLAYSHFHHSTDFLKEIVEMNNEYLFN